MLQKIVKNDKTNSIFSENFLNAVQISYTLHAELKRPAENRRLRNWNTILTARLKQIKRLNIDFKKIIKSILINCHLHGEIGNCNNRILHYKSGGKVSTLRLSLRRHNDKIAFLLGFSADLCGGPCSMEYSFRENELICFEEILSWLFKCVQCWTTLEEIKKQANSSLDITLRLK